MSASTEIQTYLLRQDSSWLRWRRGVFRAAIRLIAFGFNRLTVSDKQHIPSAGPLIMMINHTSGLDPGLIMAVTTNRFVIPMTKIENTQFLFGRLAVWWWDCYTVRRGRTRPAGRCRRPSSCCVTGSAFSLRPKVRVSVRAVWRGRAKAWAWIATKADAVILPCAISGARGWRSKWLRLQRPEIHLRFGRPFRFRKGDARRVSRERLQDMTDEAMYQLSAALVDPELRGAYSDLDQVTVQTLEFVEPA